MTKIAMVGRNSLCVLVRVLMPISFRPYALHLLALGAIGLLAGCQRFGAPNLRNPGTLLNQQFRATLHDPYPDQDAGPEMTGVRPPLFREPLPEPVRTRGLQDEWWWTP